MCTVSEYTCKEISILFYSKEISMAIIASVWWMCICSLCYSTEMKQ